MNIYFTNATYHGFIKMVRKNQPIIFLGPVQLVFVVETSNSKTTY